MTLAPAETASDGIAYSAFDRIELRGADALAFAQAQLASDVKGLENGSWQWTAYLTPQGRTIALLLLLRHADDAIDLLVPGRRGAELAGRLQRFVFRSKVGFAVVADGARGVASTGSVASAVSTGGSIDLSESISRLALAPTAWVEIATTPHDASAPAGAGSAATAAPATMESSWRHFLIHAGVPLLADAAVEAFTPHALGLDQLAAISTRKGCYPGQEIVARTHFLGRNKRRLFRFLAPSGDAAGPGTSLRDGATGNAAAMVVLANRTGDGVEGLLVGHEQIADATLLLGDAEVRLALLR